MEIHWRVRDVRRSDVSASASKFDASRESRPLSIDMNLARRALATALTLEPWRSWARRWALLCGLAAAVISGIAGPAAAGIVVLRCEATRFSRVPPRRPERLTYLYKIDADTPKIEDALGEDMCTYEGINCYVDKYIVGYHADYSSTYHGWPRIVIGEVFSVNRRDGELREDYLQSVPRRGGGRKAVISESIRGRCKRTSDPGVP